MGLNPNDDESLFAEPGRDTGLCLSFAFSAVAIHSPRRWPAHPLRKLNMKPSAIYNRVASLEKSAVYFIC
jgi:hypothetical protein